MLHNCFQTFLPTCFSLFSFLSRHISRDSNYPCTYPLSFVLHSGSTRYINQNLIELSSNRVWRMLWDIYHHIFKLKSEHQVLNQYFNFSTNRQWKTFDLFRRSPCWVGQFVNTNIFLAWLVPPWRWSDGWSDALQPAPTFIYHPPPQHRRTGEQSRSLLKVS